MRKVFCDMCGAEITVDVEYVFDHELCPDCVKAVKEFISAGRHPIHTEGMSETETETEFDPIIKEALEKVGIYL